MADTICALATAPVESGIGIIRMSGSNVIELASRFVKTKSGRDLDISKSHRIRYGYVYDGDQPIDEILVMTMCAPKSYTGEDTVEIDCHGGVLMMRKILETAIKYGARPAEPGEFTKRAFLNGRIDLSEAEAVSDIITSTSNAALSVGIAALRGGVSDRIRKIRERILHDNAFIEAELDDPEHLDFEEYRDTFGRNLNLSLEEIHTLLNTAEEGKLLREGIRTVILGKPNVGKSSLLNNLLGEERAIVTDVAGTTRDTLEEQINLGGISLKIIDTAGIRKTSDTVEQIGVDRALAAAGQADLILYVIDGSVPLDDSDRQIISFIKGRKCLIILNKSDLTTVVDAASLEKLTSCEVIPASMKESDGIELLENKIKDSFFRGDISFNDQVVITSVRQKHLLEKTLDSLQHAKSSFESGIPEDLYSVDLSDAYRFLGEILGVEVSEDLINEIFSKFCMGK